MSLVLAAAKPMFDWVGLFKVFVISAAFAIGSVILVSLAVRFSAVAATTSGGKRIGSLVVTVLLAAMVAAIVIYGITVMMTKS